MRQFTVFEYTVVEIGRANTIYFDAFFRKLRSMFCKKILEY